MQGGKETDKTQKQRNRMISLGKYRDIENEMKRRGVDRLGCIDGL